MASVTRIPVSEYLQTTYRPDREYVDGEVRERNGTRSGRMCVGQAWTAAPRLNVPDTPIYVELEDIFSSLDEPGGLA